MATKHSSLGTRKVIVISLAILLAFASRLFPQPSPGERVAPREPATQDRTAATEPQIHRHLFPPPARPAQTEVDPPPVQPPAAPIREARPLGPEASPVPAPPAPSMMDVRAFVAEERRRRAMPPLHPVSGGAGPLGTD